MSAAYITGQAGVTALGASLEELWPRLVAGASAIGPVTRFETARLNCHHAACIADLEAAGHPNRTCALMARCLDQLGIVPRETMVIWAGVKGDAEWIERRAAGESAGGDFVLPAQYREWIGRRLGTAGGGLELNAACASSAAALALGALLIERGEAASVLVCAADIVSRFTFTGFAALRALTPGICRPLDRARDGLALGDGAAAVLLMNETMMRQTKAVPLARLAGWGLANDATHITAPARDGCGLVAAIRAALARSRKAPDEVDAFCVHGTGTVYNDAMELTALEAVFGERRFPVFAVKGGVGHTLGAAGALEAALCVCALRERCVPASAGLLDPEDRAQGRASGEARKFNGNSILTTNSGFGGVNAALLIERVE